MGDKPVQRAKVVRPPVDIEEHNSRLKAQADEPAEVVEEEEPEVLLTTRDVAEYLGVTPRLLRKFLRSSLSGVSSVGQGNQYGFSPRSLAKLQDRFEAWNHNRPKRTRKE